MITQPGQRVMTLHGDRGEIAGYLTPKSEPGQRTAAIMLDAGYQIGQSETCLMPEPPACGCWNYRNLARCIHTA